MHRKIYSYLASIESLSKDSIKELHNFLKTYYFRQFRVPLHLQPIIQHLEIMECSTQTTLYNQGDPIDRYYFLLAGKVLLENKSSKLSEHSEIDIFDVVDVVGEYFYDVSTKRASTAITFPEDCPTLLLSIDKTLFHELYAPQIADYNQLKRTFSTLSSISQQTLQAKGLFKYISFSKFRFGQQINPFSLKNNISFILAGECVLKTSNGVLNLIAEDYLNLEGYFNRKDQNINTFQYRVNSSELTTCSLPFQFIDKLPTHFKEIIAFIHQCHEIAPSSFLSNSLNLSSLQLDHLTASSQINPFRLPKVDRKSTPFIQHQHSLQLLRQCEKRITHKPKKSRSTLQPELTSKQVVENFRKHYCLGYSGSKSKSYSKKEIKQPKGFFQMPSFRKDNSPDSPEISRRQWAVYLREKQRQKQKSRQHKHRLKSKQNFPSSKPADRMQQIFTKYQSIKSLAHPRENAALKKVQVRCPHKMFEFPKRK